MNFNQSHLEEIESDQLRIAVREEARWLLIWCIWKKNKKLTPSQAVFQVGIHCSFWTDHQRLLSQQIVGQISVESRPFLSDETQSFGLELFSKQMN